MDSDFGDFFSQIPPSVFLIFCGSLLLLVIVVALLVWDRRRKAARRLAASAAPPTQAAVAHTLAYDANLPDLDALAPSAAPVARGSGVSSRLKLTGGEEIEAAEVMTIYRDVAEGGLVVQVGSSIYRHPLVNADPEFRKRMIGTLRELDSAPRDTRPQPSTTPERAAPPPAPVEAAPTPPVIATSEMPPMPPGALPGDLPKFRMPDKPEQPKRGRRRPPSEPIPEINIAEAIEAFLQYKLSSNSQFAGRSIHVKPALDAGLAIEVDGRTFEAVSDVDDEAVRGFLQAAIEEWQSRQ